MFNNTQSAFFMQCFDWWEGFTYLLFLLLQMTIGVFLYPEHVISEPLGPKDIENIVYDVCQPYDPVEAVLQQEVYVLRCGCVYTVHVGTRVCERGASIIATLTNQSETLGCSPLPPQRFRL